MFGSYRRGLAKFSNLDALFYSDKWEIEEQRLAHAYRARWLRVRAWDLLVRTYVLYGVLLVMLEILAAACGAALDADSLAAWPKQFSLELRKDAWKGYWSGVIASGAFLALFVSASSSFKNYALLSGADFTTREGSLGSDEDGMPRCVVQATFFAVVIHVVYLAIVGRDAIAIWQVGIAAAFCGIMLEAAVDKYADAINVAKTGTISRPHQARRKYLR